jgi:hypothetical protein
MIGESSNKKILGGLITLGTLVGITIAAGFIVRGYLDVLRIKAIKKELKTYSDE